jgi:hypothetical protein
MALGSASSRLFLGSLLLVAGSAVVANGPMGGGGSGGSSHGGNGPMMPPVIAPAPDISGDNAGPTGPEGPGDVPYPPSGPDQSTTLVNQINQIGANGAKKDEDTWKKCNDLRQSIDGLENGGSSYTYTFRRSALESQRVFDHYSGMSLTEMKAELAVLKTQMITSENPDVRAFYQKSAATLSNFVALRERYGDGYVYQNAIKDTALYKEIQDDKEKADLYQRDVDESVLRDEKAQYAELNC